jgi:hypothetical protein
MICKKFIQSISSGGICAVLVFLFWGIVVLTGLFKTIHYREELRIGLTGLHNQILPMLSSVLLGFLALRFSLKMKIPALQTFLLGICSQTVYQTFSVNLWFYWENYPTAWLVFFTALFCLLEDFGEEITRKLKLFVFVRGIAVVGMVLSGWVGALSFLVIHAGLKIKFNSGKRPLIFLAGSVFLPAAGALVALGGKRLWLDRSHSEVDLPHVPYILTEESGFPLREGFGVFPEWDSLLVLGFVAILCVIGLSIWSRKMTSYQIFLGSWLGTYLLSAGFLNSKTLYSLEIHEVYLVFPLILALFALLPAWLEALNRKSGIFTIFTLGLAFCYTCVQLRDYAIHYPF